MVRNKRNIGGTSMHLQLSDKDGDGSILFYFNTELRGEVTTKF